jgi:NTE family protein
MWSKNKLTFYQTRNILFMRKKKIALALQGGGSHGAYTWGVLERLLEEDKFDIRGMCGASSGAMNAAIVGYGLHTGGNKGAIDLLEKFWTTVGESFTQSMLQPTIFDKFKSPGALDYSPGFHFITFLTSIVSPYDIDPVDTNTNHLKDLLLKLIDFEELRKSKVQLFATATNVLTSKPKVFNLSEMTVDVLMASAAVPLMYKAVKIDGEIYWDGILLCNPQIDPLIDFTDTTDVLIVKVSPSLFDTVPKTIKEIHNRISQISLHTSFLAEMRLLYLKNEMVDLGYDLNGKLRKVNYHEISADFVLDDLSGSSKLNHSLDFLNLLRQRGRAETEKWLQGDGQYVGVESTLDIRTVFS